MRNLTTMSHKQLEGILVQHAIPVSCWPEMKSLVFYGQRPGSGLLRRLNGKGRYANCLKSILTVLSAPLEHRFPPAGWQPAKAVA